MNPQIVIARNFAWGETYDDVSFTGQLHENGIWAHNEYWLLEWALYQTAQEDNISQELSWQVFRIFSYCFMSFGCHLDRNDLFKIKNLKRSQIYDFRERVQLVFEGFYSRNMPEQNLFLEQNPLLQTANSSIELNTALTRIASHVKR